MNTDPTPKQFKEEVFFANGENYPGMIKQFSDMAIKYSQEQPEVSKLASDIVKKLKEENNVYKQILGRLTSTERMRGTDIRRTYY